MAKNRHDGTLIKEHGTFSIINQIKPARYEGEVYFIGKYDVTDLLLWFEKKKKEYKKDDEKFTIFYVFCAAIMKTVYLRPRLNRFIINKRVYQRNNVSFGFVGKTSLEDESDEIMQCFRVGEDDTLKDIQLMLNKKIKGLKESSANASSSLIDTVTSFPNWLLHLVVRFFVFLDKHDWLPRDLTDDLIYHQTVLITNLGSIKCGAIYHNLTDFGTNEILIALGEIKEEWAFDENGKPRKRKFIEIGYTLDERVCDGFYFAKSVKYLEYILNHPDVLEKPMKEGIDFEF